MIYLANPECIQGIPGDPPEYRIGNPVRCPNCREIVDADEGCPDCKKCDLCRTDYAHPASVNQQCAHCELEGARYELAKAWREIPLDFKDTAKAEAEVRVWEALQ